MGDPASSYHVYANDAETVQVHDCTGMATLNSLEANLLYHHGTVTEKGEAASDQRIALCNGIDEAYKQLYVDVGF